MYITNSILLNKSLLRNRRFEHHHLILIIILCLCTFQVIIVQCGIGASTSNDIKQNLIKTCLEVCNRLQGVNGIEDLGDVDNSVIEKRTSSVIIRADTDLRDNYSPGWKFNHWELKVK